MFTFTHTVQNDPTMYRRKPIVQLTVNGEEVTRYVSLSYAEKATNITRYEITKVCNNEQAAAGGFIWRFV